MRTSPLLVCALYPQKLSFLFKVMLRVSVTFSWNIVCSFYLQIQIDPGQRAADATRAGSDGQAESSGSSEPAGPGRPLHSRVHGLTPLSVRTRTRPACSGPRTEGRRRLLSGTRSAPTRRTQLYSRLPAGFLAAAQRGDFSPLAGLSRARL